MVIAIFTFLSIAPTQANDINLDIEKILEDRKIGNDNAPIKIVKYASFTCGHCAIMNNKTMPEIKKQFVDTGIAQITYKSFPLDEHSMLATLMVQCAPKDKFLELYETLYQRQQDWFKSGNSIEFLANIAELTGVSREKFEACTNNQELKAALTKDMKESYTKYQINAVPALVINDGEKVVIGYKTVEQLAEIINDVKNIKKLKLDKNN